MKNTFNKKTDSRPSKAPRSSFSKSTPARNATSNVAGGPTKNTAVSTTSKPPASRYSTNRKPAKQNSSKPTQSRFAGKKQNAKHQPSNRFAPEKQEDKKVMPERKPNNSRFTPSKVGFKKSTPTVQSFGKKLKVIGLGGLEEVGRNMTVIEYDNEIIIVDMGLMFPEEDMPGIDYIIPDITYLKGRAKDIKGIVITHGHYDHIGAISHLTPELGDPPIYTTPLTAGIINKRHEEYKLPDLNITIIDPEKDKIQMGQFTVEFFRVNHNIPDSFGVVLKTPIGTIVHTGDFKIDFSPINDKPADLNRIADIGSEGVLALLADSTNAGNPGYQISESSVEKEIEKIFIEADGMIIAGTFASLLNRVQQMFTLAEKYGRKVFLDGRSMISNVDIAHKLGYMKFKPGTLIDGEEIKKYPREKILVIGTGAQGEKNAVLNRIANNDHKFVKIQRGDSMVFSSSVIPGNERTIQSLKDTFYRLGARVYHYKMMDVHAGGHAQQEDLKLTIRLFKPQFYIPIEANFYLRIINADLAKEVGVPEENVLLPENGQITEFTKQGQEVIGTVTETKVPTEYIMVDGLGVGDISNVVLRDRQVLAEDGMFVIIATISKKTGELVGSPDIISRGFVYMKESRKLIEEARHKVKKICRDNNPDHAADANEIKNKIRNEVGKFLFQKIQRRPMVLPVIIEV